MCCIRGLADYLVVYVTNADEARVRGTAAAGDRKWFEVDVIGNPVHVDVAAAFIRFFMQCGQAGAKTISDFRGDTGDIIRRDGLVKGESVCSWNADSAVAQKDHVSGTGLTAYSGAWSPHHHIDVLV